ncbi:hypothetical protein [Litorihabitans aurantiacus]|uniref:Uncharacterized protein n=1 Tax=Litorihabitans aurantiacus TaxID=1930061 RepID=A0AA37XF40_9MICO|nr:hypothetical protein [Litorihabitans aurantiacus]GMA31610.1 hypothetical protein GCM10025875_16020 [Litorihabitans aurantiacus]
MWSLFLFDTTSGRLGRQLPLPALSWTRTIGDSTILGGGQGSQGAKLTFPVGVFDVEGQRPHPVDLHSTLMPVERGVVLMWADRPWVAGLIGDRSDSREEIAFPVESLTSSVLSRRLASPDLTDGLATSTRGWSGLGRGTLVKRVVQAGLERGGLPITFDEDEAGPHSLTVAGYDLANARVSDLIRKISHEDGGPDVDLRPYLTGDGTLAWHLYTGRDAYPHIRQVTVHAITEGMLLDLRQVVSGAQVAHRVYGTGSGTGEGTLLSRIQDLDAVRGGWPLMETVASDTSADTQAQVDAVAAAHLAAHKAPLQQWEATINAGGPIPPTTIWPGDLVTLDVAGFPTIEDGRYQVRVMEMSGDTSELVRLKFDATPAIY